MLRQTILSIAVGAMLVPHGASEESSERKSSVPEAQPDPPSETIFPANPAPLKKPGGRSNINRRLNSIVARDARPLPEVRAFSFGTEGLASATAYRPLMIRSSRAEGKAMEQLSEDLAIMARLLDKAVAEHSDGFHPPTAAGINIVALAAGMPNSTRAMYVDDYGAIFTLNVNIPLKPEAKVDEGEPKATRRKGLWEETRAELFGERQRVRHWHAAAKRYDAAEVDSLKTTVLETLRNATNIRHLKPNDMITVVVRGTPQPEERDLVLQTGVEGGENVVVDETMNQESTLVFRTQKLELDKGASGKDSGDLRRAVRISVY